MKEENPRASVLPAHTNNNKSTACCFLEFILNEVRMGCESQVSTLKLPEHSLLLNPCPGQSQKVRSLVKPVRWVCKYALNVGQSHG